MRLFGFDISRSKTGPVPSTPSSYYGGYGGGWGGAGGWPVVQEPFTGAWQRNMELRPEFVLTYSAVFACVTLIASDIAKIGLRLVEEDEEGIWTETQSAAFSPVLRKPNRYQTRIKFIEQWMISKLIHGNAYILKERSDRTTVSAMYVLDPLRTKPLVAPDGEIYYQIYKDDLTGIQEDSIVIPASEIIHDTMVSLYHPLCGVSPLTACGLAATQGLNIQGNSSRLFASGSKPGGILTAPGAIDDTNAKRLKDYWDQNFSGANVGKVAVLGDGLSFQSMSINAVDSQLIEQLKWTAETVCSAYHVPPYMIGVGPPPNYSNIQALNQQYYTQALQVLIESCELCLDEGLALPRPYGTEFDIDDLLRMDTKTQVETVVAGIKGVFTPNEARKKLNLSSVTGGDTVYLQQQDFSIEALSKRDAKPDPFASAKPDNPQPAVAPVAGPAVNPPTKDFEIDIKEFNTNLRRSLGLMEPSCLPA